MPTFLAIDIGAESGRAMLGQLARDRLTIREVHRFANGAIRYGGSLRWNAGALRRHVDDVLECAAAFAPDAVGVDTWGCDYALIDSRGDVIELPYHYRDARTDGAMDLVFRRMSRDDIYQTTGIQFLPFNTLFQLAAALDRTPRIFERAARLLTMPDLVNFWLTGRAVSEFTNATTTQLVDAETRSWSEPIVARLGLRRELLPAIVEPGTIIGTIADIGGRSLAGTAVVAPACHDTGSAVAAVAAHGETAFISSGTWSLVGQEIPRPIITPRAFALNFTNEGGVAGTTRLLRNVAGLWLLQACRPHWTSGGRLPDYETLVEAARSATPFAALIDPDAPAFLHPSHMPRAIAEYCRQTSQPVPETPADVTRTILESLALKYRTVLDWIEELTGARVTTLRIIGGGARNRLLNQFTANATGRVVLAGPVEATALGNIAMQMVATGRSGTIADARAMIERCFPPERFEPRDAARWTREYARFRQYVEFACA